MPSDAYPGGVDEDLLEQETMIPRVVEVKPMEGYRLWLRFHDGMTGIVDLSSELWGEMFEPLEDAAGAGSGVVPTVGIFARTLELPGKLLPSTKEGSKPAASAK